MTALHPLRPLLDASPNGSIRPVAVIRFGYSLLLGTTCCSCDLEPSRQ